MDILKIVLTGPEQSAFDKFLDQEEAILTKDEFQLLLRKSLVLDAMDGKSGWFGELPEKGMCKLSQRGMDLRALQSIRRRQEKKDNLRYWITTGIATLALIKSFWPELASLWTLLTQ